MSRLNLNKPEDFAALTMSQETANAMFRVFAIDKSKWDISEGGYRGGRKNARNVLFHVFKSKSDYQAGLSKIQDTGGRRKAKFLFPYVDGQSTDDLGRKPGVFEIEALFHGAGYKAGLNRFMAECHDPIPGTLEHPVFGVLRCGMVDYTIEHSHDSKQAALVHVRFEEHNFESIQFDSMAIGNIKTPKSALQSMIAAIQGIAAAIAAVQQIKGALTAVVADIKAKLVDLYNFAVNLATDAAASFGLTGFDIGAILPINIGGVLAPFSVNATAGGVNPVASFGSSASTAKTAGVSGLATTTGGFVRVSTRFTTVSAPADPFANLPIELLGDIARDAIQLTQLSRRSETMREMANEILSDSDVATTELQRSSVASTGRAASAAQALTTTKLAALEACSSMADVLRSGSTNGRPSIIEYTTPRTMSIREAAFENGLSPQDGNDIVTLNPSLVSANWIEKGTVLKVPAFI